MAKSRGFSIYLLKDAFSPSNALKDDHSLEILSEDNTNLPNGSIMYLANNPGSPPWWKNYWGIDKNLHQVQKGALVFLPVNKRWVALTFGMTYHQLCDNCYEYDFGLKTTLNALDPQKIKSTDILQPENAKRQRIQIPAASSLNFFDIRHDESIIKKLSGAVKSEYRDLFKNATGANSLRISSNLQPHEITGLCIRLIEIYDKTDYLKSFPDIQNIVPVKDPDKIDILNHKLVDEFKKTPKELVLAIPEIVDYSNTFKVKYSGAGRSNTEYDDVYIGDYRNYLEERNITEINEVDLSKHQMNIIDENGDIIKSYNIYKSLFFDCVIDGNSYHLNEGEWYFIDSNYIKKLENALNPYFINSHPFLHDCENMREDDYNISVKDINVAVKCLDKTNISPNGQTAVEPCDLITVAENKLNLIHVKISTRSSSLSHLFNQGVNSVELLRLEKKARDKLKNLIANDNQMVQLIDQGLYSVTYGIVTKKSGTSEQLPIFSRISLLRAVNSLKLMNISCSIFFIKDNVERKKIKQL